MKMIDYSLKVHRFRFAAWCAATAASASSKCRFAVKTGVQILERSGMDELAGGWSELPMPDDFDRFHNESCEKIIQAAEDMNPKKFKGSQGDGKFTYGVAAKLLNCYLKPLFITGVRERISLEDVSKQRAIHPPIDRLLLSELHRNNVFEEGIFWKKYMNLGWSNFGKDDYCQCISKIKQNAPRSAMWEIERYWPIYQGDDK